MLKNLTRPSCPSQRKATSQPSSPKDRRAGLWASGALAQAHGCLRRPSRTGPPAQTVLTPPSGLHHRATWVRTDLLSLSPKVRPLRTEVSQRQSYNGQTELNNLHHRQLSCRPRKHRGGGEGRRSWCSGREAARAWKAAERRLRTGTEGGATTHVERWEDGIPGESKGGARCRDRTEHHGAMPRTSQGLSQASSWAILSSMGFVLEARQGWHRIRRMFVTMNLDNTRSKIPERGKASVEEAWWSSGCCKHPEKS